jgi:hypothetical protein
MCVDLLKRSGELLGELLGALRSIVAIGLDMAWRNNLSCNTGNIEQLANSI